MKTKLQIIAELKAEYPNLRVGDEEQGYTELSSTDYEATIEAWAENLVTENAKEEAAIKAAADKVALLDKLGITEDEAKLLLS